VHSLRTTGPSIADALKYGIMSNSMKVSYAGILPTPAISHITKTGNYTYGISITASHNPAQDNGIKIFDRNGNKISRELEIIIEDASSIQTLNDIPEPISLYPNEISEDALQTYANHLLNSTNLNGFSNIKVAYDLANGAAIPVMLYLSEYLGLERTFLTGIETDGLKINEECGATSPNNIANYTKDRNADIGFSFDGDSDRIVVCDEKGEVVNGDVLLALLAESLHENEKLTKDSLVITEYSNLALDNYLAKKGIKTIRVDNGDKNVSELMRKHGYSLGGEFSGHIIFNEYTNSGDGILTSLKLLELISRKQKPLSELIPSIELNPQVIESIELSHRAYMTRISDLEVLIRKIKKDFGQKGRILVRMSGTEPKLRIMSEHHNKDKAEILVMYALCESSILSIT
jgi:phosphoglucosamine mutase